jgi:DNA-binding transcriptional LysR family regulator
MSLNSSFLDAFLACAQVQNFTRAAERLFITQSTLSQRIKNLEDELNVTLIIRDRSGLRLTEYGEALLRYCQTKEQLEDQLIGRIKNKNSSTRLSGTIRIGGFSSVMRSVILPALSKLLHIHPELRIKSLSKEVYELRSLLKSGAIDFMILDEKLESENLITQVLGYEENVMMIKKRRKN